MNIKFDVDCTPEEVRRLMGLPDMGPVHDVYLDKVKKAIDEGVGPEAIERMIRTWAPMGDAGMDMMRGFLDQISGQSKKKK